jgi:zinc protease
MKGFRATLYAACSAAWLTIAVSAQVPQPAPPPPLDLQQPIPFDAAVRTGRLDNGVMYFVRQNAYPEKRLSLRLAIKAGSLFEDDDQQGLAHLIEHMAFNGSAHFKPGELVSYFESTGARLGPHVNAYTSFDETVYMLDLPSDSKEVVAKGLTAMADFAGGLTLDPEQIDKERGVVVEEWRGRLGAGTRIRDQQLPVLYYQSRYADRLPIGKPDVIRSAPAARLRAFYDTWYRPERVAIVAVGDASASELEAGIREAFGPLRDRGPAVAPPDSRVPLHKEALTSVTVDAEVTSTSVQLLRKRPREDNSRVGDYRRGLIDTLLTRMLNERFDELARKPDAKFITAASGNDSLSPTVSTFGLSARVKDGGIAAGLTALEVEARRVREYGFTAPELDRAKRWLTAFYERAYNERNKNESGSFAQEYLNYFLRGEPSPGIEYEYRLVEQALRGITLEDVAALARDRLSGDAVVILAVTPRKDDVPVPRGQDLETAVAAAGANAITPWAEETTARPLLDPIPAPAAITSRRELRDVAVTLVRFANGVEAWLKPTDFKNDQILFTMYALGGTSLASEADYMQARFATQYVGLSGLAGIKALDLDRMLAGKIVSVSPYISTSTHGVNGSASPAALETALQLLYQNFNAPGDDPDALALLKRQLEVAVANRGRSPGQVFGEKAAEVNSSGHFTSKPFTADQIPLIDRAKMISFYRERFANAADFTLFMVGAFEVDSVLPLLQRYVGSLPSTGQRTSTFKQLGIRFPVTVQRVRVEKGREPRSQTLISFSADPSFDPLEQERVIAATAVLDTVLRDSLREALGQTYTVSVGLQQSAPQQSGGYVAVSFGGAPENIDTMVDHVLNEVRKLQMEGPPADLVAKAKEGARRDYETALKQNGYWMGRLQRIHLIGGNPTDVLTRNQRIDSLTPAVIQETFKKYFPMDRYTVVTLVPEASVP